jgi:hypothetical protein
MIEGIITASFQDLLLYKFLQILIRCPLPFTALTSQHHFVSSRCSLPRGVFIFELVVQVQWRAAASSIVIPGYRQRITMSMGL